MFIFCTYCLYTTIGGAQQEVEGTQWGRPGPGGTYWRPSAITGQGFMDKMVSGVWCPISGTRCRHYCNSGCWQGWVTSDDPRKRQFEVKHGEAESIKAEMSSLARRRQSEHREIMSEVQLTMANIDGKLTIP